MNKEVIKKLTKEFPDSNIHALPKIDKVVVNVGCGQVTSDPKYLEKVTKDLKLITGQIPIQTKAKKAISGFKIRKNLPIGLKVTLRGKRMEDFISRLINITLPRIRDFRGIKKSAITSDGNINIGIREHVVFPEVRADQVEKVFSLQINIVTTAKSKQEAKKLLTAYGAIFEK